VTLPTGVVPTWGKILVDTAGDVFFKVTLPAGGMPHTWRWNAQSNVAGEMPGVGMPDSGAATDLYWADRGQIIWWNGIDTPAGGVYATDISTGTARQLTDNSAMGLDGLVGVDAANVYATWSACLHGGCGLTVYGVPRDGGAPFVAYQNDTNFGAGSFQVDDSGLYWMANNEAIYHANQPDAAATVVADLSPLSSTSSEFALDACNVYWIDVDQSAAQRLFAIAK
jgi:hypothetical protein